MSDQDKKDTPTVVAADHRRRAEGDVGESAKAQVQRPSVIRTSSSSTMSSISWVREGSKP